MEVTALVISVLAGFFIGLPTGPARFFVVDSYLNSGRRAALKVYFGLFSAILIYAGLALLTAGFLARNPQVEAISFVLGSILLISWGVFIVVKSRKGSGKSMQIGDASGFKTGFLTGISSPVTPFIYLTLIQLLKINSGSDTVFGILIYLLIFEVTGFLTTFTLSYFAHRNKKEMKSGWNTAKLIMGVFLIGIGTYNLFQLLEYQEGFKIREKENLLEQQIES